MSDLTNENKKVVMSEPEKVDPVDAVFVIGTGSNNNNEELRYALRNIDRFCPFIRDVYICGECPSWVNKSVVKHLKWPDRFTHAKDANIIDKLRHACEHPGIAKKILFCSDDQFVTRVCKWEDFAPRWLRRYSPSDQWYENRKRTWHTRLRNTLEKDRNRRLAAGLDPDNVYYYQPHIWMPIDRDKFIEYAKWSGYETRDDTIIASGYFNYIDAPGKFNYDHTFLTADQKWPVASTHIAYSDTSFIVAMRYLKNEFNEPSKYEYSIEQQKLQKSELAKLQTKVERLGNEALEVVPRERILEAVQNNPIWASLGNDINIAESMRVNNMPGWDTVWHDIAIRWGITTSNGKYYIPVTLPFALETQNIIAQLRESPVLRGAQKAAGKEETHGELRKCSKCEERRRAQKAAQEKEQIIVNEEPPKFAVMREIANEKPPAERKEACVECAIDHLSVAIAYLSDNSNNPTSIDIILAKGEATVAARNLDTPRYKKEHDKCIEAIESINSENSKFSSINLYDILVHVVDKAH